MADRSLFAQTAPHPEASSLVAFAGNRLNRQSEHRTADSLPDALKQDGAHVYAFSGSKLVLKHEEQILDPLFAPATVLRGVGPGIAPLLDRLMGQGDRPAGLRRHEPGPGQGGA